MLDESPRSETSRCARLSNKARLSALLPRGGEQQVHHQIWQRIGRGSTPPGCPDIAPGRLISPTTSRGVVIAGVSAVRKADRWCRGQRFACDRPRHSRASSSVTDLLVLASDVKPHSTASVSTTGACATRPTRRRNIEHIQIGERHTVKPDFSGRWIDEPTSKPQQRGLSGSTGARIAPCSAPAGNARDSPHRVACRAPRRTRSSRKPCTAIDASATSPAWRSDYDDRRLVARAQRRAR